jgi:hypothetical protein
MSGKRATPTVAKPKSLKKNTSPENTLHAKQKETVRVALERNQRKAEIEALRASVPSVGRKLVFSSETPKRGPGARGSLELPTPSAAAGAGTHEPAVRGSGAASLERFRQMIAAQKNGSKKGGGNRGTRRVRPRASQTRRKLKQLAFSG